MKKNDVRIPELSISVESQGSQLAVFCWFMERDPSRPAEVTAAIIDNDSRTHLLAILREAIGLLTSDDWYSLDGLDIDSVSKETGEPPF